MFRLKLQRLYPFKKSVSSIIRSPIINTLPTGINKFITPTRSFTDDTNIKKLLKVVPKRDWPIPDENQANLHQIMYETVYELDLWEEFQDKWFDRRIVNRLHWSHFKYVKTVLLSPGVSGCISTKKDRTDALMAMQFISKHGLDNYVELMLSHQLDFPTKADDWPNVSKLDKNALQATYEVIDVLKLWDMFGSMPIQHLYSERIFTDPVYYLIVTSHPKLRNYDDQMKLECLHIVKYIHYVGWKQFCYYFK